MEYKNFGEEIEQQSPVELHKTDYNNYSDLSHFVDEYYKAQALINECNNFYKSFLRSKLLPYSKIVDNAYTSEKYKFFKYSLSDSACGQSISVVEEFPVLEEMQKDNGRKPYSGVYERKTIMGITYLASIGAALRLKKEMDNDSKCKYYLHIEIYNTHNHVTNECNYRGIPKYLILKKDTNVYLDMYGSLKNLWRVDGETENEYEKRVESAYKAIGYTKDNLYDKTKKIRDSVEEKWREYYREEIVRLFDKYNVSLYINVINDLCTDAYHCLTQYKRKNNIKETEFDKYFSLRGPVYSKTLITSQQFYVNLQDYIDKDKLNEILIDYVLHEGVGHWGYGPHAEILAHVNRDKLNEYISNQLAPSSEIFRKILMTYENDIDNQKLYIIDENNNARYFCDVENIPQVNIQLKERELYCTYETEHRYKKYAFPSDGPTTVEVTNRTVVFDVDDNSIKSFNESKYSHEESYRNRRYS